MSRILMVTPEAAPFAKTGGLADVLGALPAALAALGEEVAVVLPRYRSATIRNSERIWHAMPVTLGPNNYMVAIDQVIVGNQATGRVRYMFVDCPALYGRTGIYGDHGIDFPDNHLRFGVLNMAAINIARDIFRPGVFHGHDWPAGLLGPYLHEILKTDPTFFGSKLVLTLHNVGYQGNFPPGVAAELGLDPRLMHTEGLEFWGQLSFLKSGIVWADAITTVSPTYAREIQTPEYGYGLDGLLRQRASRVSGLLNGADYEEWNPEVDPHITANFSAADLSGKAQVKRALLGEFELTEEIGLREEVGQDVGPSRPVIGIVSRLVFQKGFDVLPPVIAELAATERFTVIALGSGEPPVEESFRQLARAFPHHFAVEIGYDHGLSHRIVAGSDMFLMPSRYEPCGLGQIYALRYGSVPIVRATGGLDDTVDESIGFKFVRHAPEDLLGAMRAALAAWKNQKLWKERMRRGMRKDFSWDASALEYQKLYHSL
jgi:starch synthase